VSQYELSEQLKLLSVSNNRSKTARLRELIGEVEGAIAAGVSQSLILAALHKHGLEMTSGVFRNTLFRIRKERYGRVQKVLVAEPVSRPLSHRLIASTSALESVESIAGSDFNEIGVDPVAKLNKIIGAPVDLAALARIGRDAKGKDNKK